MKKFLLVLVPLLLLVLFNSCATGSESQNATNTAEALTHTAESLPPSPGPPPTLDSLSPLLFDYLNLAIGSMEISDKFIQLEHINGASYQVIHVELQPQNSPPTVFRADVRCECARNDLCCSPTRTFVVTIMAMDVRYNPSYPITQSIPGTVATMEVWCYDHANLTNVLSVPWADVLNFLQGSIDGFQLWSRVTTPQPDP